jgi:hypothetical protein
MKTVVILSIVAGLILAFFLGMCISIYLCAYLLSDVRHYLRCIRDDIREIKGGDLSEKK